MGIDEMESARSRPPRLSRDELTRWIQECISEHVGRPAAEIRPDLPFATLGLDSVYAFVIIAQIEDHLELSLDPTVIWDRPTLRELVEAVEDQLGASG